ncbi:hypothetical protein ACLOJK_019352 [Asimina triloba]
MGALILDIRSSDLATRNPDLRRENSMGKLEERVGIEDSSSWAREVGLELGRKRRDLDLELYLLIEFIRTHMTSQLEMPNRGLEHRVEASTRVRVHRRSTRLGAPSPSPRPAAMAAGGELSDGGADGRSKPPKRIDPDPTLPEAPPITGSHDRDDERPPTSSSARSTTASDPPTLSATEAAAPPPASSGVVSARASRTFYSDPDEAAPIVASLSPSSAAHRRPEHRPPTHLRRQAAPPRLLHPSDSDLAKVPIQHLSGQPQPEPIASVLPHLPSISEDDELLNRPMASSMSHAPSCPRASRRLADHSSHRPHHPPAQI